MKGILYYDTKYGTTERIGRWILSEISCASVSMKHIKNCTYVDPSCDFYILGSPIYIGKPRYEIYQFILENKAQLENKVLFWFITSWAQSTVYRRECERFVDIMQYYLESAKAVLWASLPGKLVFDELTERDRSTMARLLGRIDKLSEEFQSENIVFTDKTNEKESRKFGKDIDQWLQHSGNML